MKVLILTASYGDGHNAAARNVQDALEVLGGEGCRVEVLDLLQVAYGRLNQFVRSAYIGLVRHAPALWGTMYQMLDRAPSLTSLGSLAPLRRTLSDVLAETEPDVVLSTYPIYAALIRDLYRDHAERPFRFYTIVTNSITVHSSWYRAASDYWCVANSRTADVLVGAGVSRSKILTTGFPVSPGFLDDAMEPCGPPVCGGPVRILYVVHHGVRKVGRTLEDLLGIPGVELTVTTGRDGKLKGKLLARLESYGERVRVLGWTNLMPRLLQTHHFVIGKAGGASVQEAIAASCPMILNQAIPGQKEGNARLVVEEGYGARAGKRGEFVGAVKAALAEDAALWRNWRANLQRGRRADAAFRIAGHVMTERVMGAEIAVFPRVVPGGFQELSAGSWSGGIRAASRGPLLCDFHTHTNYSDGPLTVSELVDFYGNHGFDCICITDHLADPRRLIGKLARLSRLTVNPDQLEEYFEVIRREAARALRRYGMLVMAGMEFNKDGCTAKSSAHLLGIDLKRPIRPDLDLPETIGAIHVQGGLAAASHPHVMKSEWGKNTLYLWENQERFTPLIDAWEIANRENIFSPVALKRLPFLASSDFHKPTHIYSWKTLLDCPKDPEAIKECIRRNERVSITLYRKHGRREERAALLNPAEPAVREPAAAAAIA